VLVLASIGASAGRPAGAGGACQWPPPGAAATACQLAAAALARRSLARKAPGPREARSAGGAWSRGPVTRDGTSRWPPPGHGQLPAASVGTATEWQDKGQFYYT
jgi:hypothetical protein